MLHTLLAKHAEKDAERTFFRCDGEDYSYARTLEASRELAGRLASSGVSAGDRVALDLPNSPQLVLVLFAGSMLGISFYLLNHRLTDAKKAELLRGYEVARTIDEAALAEIAALETSSFEAHTADESAVFVRMFTSGSSGVPKCAQLTYGNLLAAARVQAEMFLTPGEGVWQLVLPMYHVGGLQVVLRSLVNRSAFLLYGTYDPDKVVADLADGHATHISVVDKMLADLVEGAPGLIGSYKVVLLGGGPANAKTLSAASGASVWVSYGMTEACATVAASPLEAFRCGRYTGSMQVLSGYKVRILEPNDAGRGEICIAGDAVFAGYEARPGEPESEPSFTAGGCFRTGDFGYLHGERLVVEERLSDLLISGGENVYPREIEREIEALEGVEEAAVIGVASEKWGRRPVAFFTGPAGVTEIRERLAERLSGFQRPDHVFRVEEMPRRTIGKISKSELQKAFDERIEIAAVNLYRISQPLAAPFVTSRVTLTERESVIVEVVDHAGRRGYGESVAFSTSWYHPETVASTLAAIRDYLAPALTRTAYLHPDEVFDSFADLDGNLMAKGAIEPACWDLYGRIVGRPLPEILAEWLGVGLQSQSPAGVSIGVMSVEDTLAEVAHYVGKGYTRVKLKIRPGDDTERVRAVREAYPDLMLMADANGAYTADDVEVFQALDAFGLACIEEPISVSSFSEMAYFQSRIATPVSVDESVVTEEDLAEVLRHDNLRNINLKIGKFGGLLPSLRLYRECAGRGVELWLGGMFETGISKYLHAEFERLEGFRIPGDISESRRYFERDIVKPEVSVADGNIVLPDGPGLGFEIDRERLEQVLIEKIEVARDGD